MSSGARSTIDGAIARARDEQNWLTIALAEYSAIRAEIVQALQAQHAIVSYGASALAVLTAVAIGTAAGGATKSDGLITFLFLVLNPLLVVVIFMVWGSEVLRMQRAGMYLFVVEKALNARVPGPPPLNWEHAVNPPPPVGTPGSGMRLLRTRRTFPHVDLVQRIAVPAALLAMVAGSIAAGLAMGGLDWLVSLSIPVDRRGRCRLRVVGERAPPPAQPPRGPVPVRAITAGALLGRCLGVGSQTLAFRSGTLQDPPRTDALVVTGGRAGSPALRDGQRPSRRWSIRAPSRAGGPGAYQRVAVRGPTCGAGRPFRGRCAPTERARRTPACRYSASESLSIPDPQRVDPAPPGPRRAAVPAGPA